MDLASCRGTSGKPLRTHREIAGSKQMLDLPGLRARRLGLGLALKKPRQPGEGAACFGGAPSSWRASLVPWGVRHMQIRLFPRTDTYNSFVLIRRLLTEYGLVRWRHYTLVFVLMGVAASVLSSPPI